MDSNLSNHRKSFCPQPESRILKSMIGIAGNGLHYIYYKRLFDNFESTILNANRDWFTLTINGYYDLAVYNWGMLFGSKSEPTHYKKLITYDSTARFLSTILTKNEICEQDLYDYLLKSIGVSDAEYKRIHKQILDYRNRYLTHREHAPEEINNGDLIFPQLDNIRKSFESVYLVLVKILQFYPDAPSTTCSYPVCYLSVNSHTEIEDFIEHTFPDFNGTLFESI